MTTRPTHVRFEHHAEGTLGIGESRPRLSWRRPAGTSTAQLGYAVEVSHDGTTTSWEVEGSEQTLVPWEAPSLGSRTAATVRVRVRDAAGWGAWSDGAHTETGLLDARDWSAGFISSARADSGAELRRPVRMTRRFSLPDDVVWARVYVTAHGVAELEVNGRRVGDQALTPGWTSYAHRLRYATFDVTSFLVPGANVIGAWLGDGWYRGRIGFRGGLRDFYGSDLALLAQLEIRTASGDTIVVATDDQWSEHDSPILESGLYEGETFDGRLHDAAWSTTGGIPEGHPVRVAAAAPELLVAPTGPPVRATEELVPRSVRRVGDRLLLDFGQNHSGRLRIRIRGERGARVTLRHAEVLQDGELYVRPLRGATSTDAYILRGDPEGETWEPRFTLHGYRYAELSGWPGELEAGDVVSRVYGTDLERTGWFACSNDDVNRLHENVVWSLRSNFVDIPTDCPQRDERLGWTGDIQVFATTAAFLYDTTGMLASWLRDVDEEQREWGFVPFYVPYLPLGSWKSRPKDPSAVWGDVTVLTPWDLYQATADRGLLARQFDSGRRFVDHAVSAAGPDLVCRGAFQLGDWLDPAAPPDDPFAATTDPDLVATAYLAHSARRLADIAAILGEHSARAHYADVSARATTGFQQAFVTDAGTLTDDTQTAYALAIVFDLLPEALRVRAGDRLAELVRAAGGRIATGFAGTPIVADALTRSGHHDEAYLLLLCRENPSWLYALDQGATTIWERWDSMLPDGTVNPGEMTSFNHYALGSIAAWLHATVAGVRAVEPGYRRILFEPRPGGGLTWARARHASPLGDVAIDWSLDADGTLTVTTVVPAGATAELRIGAHVEALGAGTVTRSLTPVSA